ncbi:hypothetical protein [Gilliamella sp. Pas-s95]|uniref:hypothetical protein n=1 Tax=Gilliamella sp. Pas-s95 TaxID=2687317 RepID=UPI00132B3185|nr:hypothetical protein [Gilliamella sp. Pas-s95]MWN05434.1 hypothetical protein [Gilliamella sp. Pas-s95]
MKALKNVLIILTTAMILTGCEEKNEEYYLNNIDSANKKVEQCNQDLEKAFIANDKGGIEKVEKNPECRAAMSAIEKDRKIKYELEKKRKEDEKKQAVESEMSAIRQQVSGMSWGESVDEYLKVDECKSSFSFNKSPKCEAWETVYKEKVDEGKKELKQLSFNEIKAKMQSLCKLDKRTGSKCSVAQKALEEKAADELANVDIQTIESKKSLYCAEDLVFQSACNVSWEKAWKKESDKYVKFYTENNAEFVATYNSCIDKLEAVKAQKLNWNEENKLQKAIKEGYPCSQVKDAYTKRGMGYSWFYKKIEE